MIENLDTITLSDNNEYIVVSHCKLGEHNYLYLVDTKNSSNVKFMEYKSEGLEEISENERVLISKLVKEFTIDINRFYGKNNEDN